MLHAGGAGGAGDSGAAAADVLTGIAIGADWQAQHSAALAQPRARSPAASRTPRCPGRVGDCCDEEDEVACVALLPLPVQ